MIHKRFIALLGALVFSVAQAQTPPPTAGSGPDIPIIDVHTHTSFDGKRDAARRIQRTE